MKGKTLKPCNKQKRNNEKNASLHAQENIHARQKQY